VQAYVNSCNSCKYSNTQRSNTNSPYFATKLTLEEESHSNVNKHKSNSKTGHVNVLNKARKL